MSLQEISQPYLDAELDEAAVIRSERVLDRLFGKGEQFLSTYSGIPVRQYGPRLEEIDSELAGQVNSDIQHDPILEEGEPERRSLPTHTLAQRLGRAVLVVGLYFRRPKKGRSLHSVAAVVNPLYNYEDLILGAPDPIIAPTEPSRPYYPPTGHRRMWL